jgi:hypothetical protein
VRPIDGWPVLASTSLSRIWEFRLRAFCDGDKNDELFAAVGGGRSQASPRVSLLFDNGTAP